MLDFLKNFAFFGFLYAAWQWLKERVCGAKNETDEEGTEGADED